MTENSIATTATGTLDHVKWGEGKFHFTLKGCDQESRSPIHQSEVAFSLSEAKALQIANADECFPQGVRIKVSGRYKAATPRKLTHVKILAVDGVEVTAWSQRAGSPTQDADVLRAAQQRIKEAEAAEEDMVKRAPPEQPGAITDPVKAYDNGMRIVRRQRRLKNPQLSQEEIWQVRDALNLLAEKLGIA